MTRDEALELIDRMPYITVIKAPNDKIRTEFYKTAVESGEYVEWIRVVKSYYLRTHNGSGKRLTTSKAEADLAAKAKHQLEAELAKALDIPEEEVEGFINDYLD